MLYYFFYHIFFFYCFVCHLLLLSNWGLEIVHMYFRFIVLWCFCSCSWHLEFFTCTSELCASVRFQHLFCGGGFFFFMFTASFGNPSCKVASTLYCHTGDHGRIGHGFDFAPSGVQEGGGGVRGGVMGNPGIYLTFIRYIHKRIGIERCIEKG